MADTGKSEAKHRTKEATDLLLAKRQAALSEGLGFQTRVTADMVIYEALLASEDRVQQMVANLAGRES
jgi:hypothetical protein